MNSRRFLLLELKLTFSNLLRDDDASEMQMISSSTSHSFLTMLSILSNEAVERLEVDAANYSSEQMKR